MSLIVVAVATAVAATVGYLAARSRGKPGADGGAPKGDTEDARQQKASEKGKPSAPEPAPFATLPLALGDVVSQASEERWLAGALVASDGGRVVSALFVAPEGGTNQAVAAFARPRLEIYWLAPTQVECPEEPPATLEIGGTSYSRRARLPVKVARMGQGAPDIGDTAIWGSYEAGGRDVAVVLCARGQVHAWSGMRLDEGEYDRLGTGGEG